MVLKLTVASSSLSSFFARQKEDSRHGGRHSAQQSLACQGGNGLSTGFRATKAVLHHVGLQDSTLQVDVVVCQGLELRSQNLLSHLGAVVDVMIALVPTCSNMFQHVPTDVRRPSSDE